VNAGRLLDGINDAESDFGRSEIILVVVPQLFTTLATCVFVIVQAGISCTDSGFHTPAVFQYPMVAVRDTCTIDIAVIAVVAQPEDVEIAHVNIGIMAMETEKTTVETFAKPVAEFRLYQPVLDLSVFGKFPGIVVARYIKSEFFPDFIKITIICLKMLACMSYNIILSMSQQSPPLRRLISQIVYVKT